MTLLYKVLSCIVENHEYSHFAVAPKAINDKPETLGHLDDRRLKGTTKEISAKYIYFSVDSTTMFTQVLSLYKTVS